ncbi:hypothetical protein HHK36_028313 [Tetracentron sinense]|uniref:Pentatricopeptide repeat-containing protein n=1 Tax=Tetracentron sinense TaxID=13715 RepID=A0A834YGD8_TETSI|nr:hypothetical protein HHK36_028313 [Tetracentron sinense]
MFHTNVKPNDLTFSLLIKACSSFSDSLNAKQEAFQIQTHLIISAFDQFIYLGTALLDFYAKSGCISIAHQLFEDMPHRDLIAWNALICEYSRNGYDFDALKLFIEMLKEGVSPCRTTLVCVLPSCARPELLFLGRSMYGFRVKTALDLDCRVKNTLTSIVISWNTMIGMYAQNGFFNETLLVFKLMREEGIGANSVTIVNLLSAKAHLDSTHSHVIKTVDTDAYLLTSLVCMYVKDGNTESTGMLYETLPQKDLISLTAIISSYGSGSDHLTIRFYSFYGCDPSFLTHRLLHDVSEPLRTSIRGAPLEDARHLTRHYDKIRQEVETQAAEVIRRQSKSKEAGTSSESSIKLQNAEAKLSEIKSTMIALGTEATAAMLSVEAQQQRITFQRLLTMVISSQYVICCSLWVALPGSSIIVSISTSGFPWSSFPLLLPSLSSASALKEHPSLSFAFATRASESAIFFLQVEVAGDPMRIGKLCGSLGLGRSDQLHTSISNSNLGHVGGGSRKIVAGDKQGGEPSCTVSGGDPRMAGSLRTYGLGHLEESKIREAQETSEKGTSAWADFKLTLDKHQGHFVLRKEESLNHMPPCRWAVGLATGLEHPEDHGCIEDLGALDDHVLDDSARSGQNSKENSGVGEGVSFKHEAMEKTVSLDHMKAQGLIQEEESCQFFPSQEGEYAVSRECGTSATPNVATLYPKEFLGMGPFEGVHHSEGAAGNTVEARGSFGSDTPSLAQRAIAVVEFTISLLVHSNISPASSIPAHSA